MSSNNESVRERRLAARAKLGPVSAQLAEIATQLSIEEFSEIMSICAKLSQMERGYVTRVVHVESGRALYGGRVL